MKKCFPWAFLIAGVGLLAGISRYQIAAGAAPNPVATEELTAAQSRADFDLMRHALEEAHTGLYRYTAKPEMDQAFNTRRAELNRSMKKTEFLPIIQEMLAKIRCGHTNVSPDDQTKQAFASARMLPLRTLIEGNRLMVVLNDTPDDQTISPGMEILEINGHKATELLKQFMQYISADGDIETGKRHDLSNRFAQYYYLLVDQSGQFTLKAADATGKTVTAKLAGATDADRKSNQNPVNGPMKAAIAKVMGGSPENQTLRFLKDPGIALIRLRYFVGDGFPQWIEETFKTLRDKGTRTLIIDLRGNGGGEDMYGALLVSYLTDKPFRYFDHIDVKTYTLSFKEFSDWSSDHDAELREFMLPKAGGGFLVSPKLHRGLEEQQPGKYPFLGKVFVLTEGGTFSTAADFCAVTHHLQRATFIGEETGGGYYGNNSGMETALTLPNSKFKIHIPMYEYWNAVSGYDGKRRGTIPDHVVPMTTADVLRGVDGPLDLAVKLATMD